MARQKIIFAKLSVAICNVRAKQIMPIVVKVTGTSCYETIPLPLVPEWFETAWRGVEFGYFASGAVGRRFESCLSGQSGK